MIMALSPTKKKRGGREEVSVAAVAPAAAEPIPSPPRSQTKEKEEEKDQGELKLRLLIPHHQIHRTRCSPSGNGDNMSTPITSSPESKCGWSPPLVWGSGSIVCRGTGGDRVSSTVVSSRPEMGCGWSPPLTWDSIGVSRAGGGEAHRGSVGTRYDARAQRRLTREFGSMNGEASKISFYPTIAAGDPTKGSLPSDGTASKIPIPSHSAAGCPIRISYPGDGIVSREPVLSHSISPVGSSSSMVSCPPDERYSRFSIVESVPSTDGLDHLWTEGPRTYATETTDTMDGNVSRMSLVDTHTMSSLDGLGLSNMSGIESPAAIKRIDAKLFLFETVITDKYGLRRPPPTGPSPPGETQADSAWRFIAETLTELDHNPSRMCIAETTSSMDGLGPKVSPSPSPSPSSPREARGGFTWRLLPDADRPEKQNRKKKKTKGKKCKQAKDRSASSSSLTPGGVKSSDCGSRRPSVFRALTSPRWVNSGQRWEEEQQQVQQNQQHQSPLSSVAFTPRPSLASRSTTTDKDKRGSGLYRRSKQFIRELRRSSATQKPEHIPPPNVSDSDSTKSRTRELLEKASSLLRVSISIDGGLNLHGRKSASRTPSPSGESGSSSRHNVYNRILHRYGTGMSKSSSVLNLLMGKPPATTPSEDAMYTAAAGKGNTRNDYFKVEISDPDGPNFLPSEAKRIGTPPLPSDRPRKGNLRGFFFDYGSPGGTSYASDDDGSDGDGGSQLELRSAGRSSTMESDGRLSFPFETTGQDEYEYRPFELNVPEHLPGSPLCPKSPLHPSGGRGICVYHGRRKTLPTSV